MTDNNYIPDDNNPVFDEYWKKRHTVRNFLPRDISDDLLLELIDKASKAPTTGGMQLYSIIITRNEETLKNLACQHFNQPAATGAPIMLTIVADFNRFEHWCRLRRAKPGFNNFESFVAALLDAVIFAQQLNTLLELSGIGVCYLGTTTYNASKIGDILNLPQLTVPVVTLAIGYPDNNCMTGDAERIDTDSIIHHEVYHQYSDVEIDQIFAGKEALEQNKKYVTENHVPSLAHVFTDIRYPEEAARIFSQDFYNYIERQGFHFPDIKR